MDSSLIPGNLWNSSDEELVVIHRLNNIVRYNTKNKINPETVAAHSFFASYFVISICSQYSIPDDVKLMALESTVVHDVPEVFINDITYDCKQLVKGISELLEGYEQEIISRVSWIARKVLFDPDTPALKLAQAIVIYADTLSVKQYALSEVELGNKLFIEINAEADRRIEKCVENFKEALYNYISHK